MLSPLQDEDGDPAEAPQPADVKPSITNPIYDSSVSAPVSPAPVSPAPPAYPASPAYSASPSYPSYMGFSVSISAPQSSLGLLPTA